MKENPAVYLTALNPKKHDYEKINIFLHIIPENGRNVFDSFEIDEEKGKYEHVLNSLIIITFLRQMNVWKLIFLVRGNSLRINLSMNIYKISRS